MRILRRTMLSAPLLIALAVPPAAADTPPPDPYQRPGVNELVSVGVDGQPANNHSYTADLSVDGRYVVFFSRATNLVDADISGAGDIYRRDRVAGVTELVSVRDGGPGNSSAFQPAVSADGHVVAFVSSATDLVEGDEGSPLWGQVFLRDLRTGVTKRVTAGPDGGRANGGSLNTAVSPDGRYVAFLSHASDLVPDDTNDVGDVFVHDRETGLTERVSVALDGSESDGISSRPAFSGDGEWVAFYSRATNLVPIHTVDRIAPWILTVPVQHAYIRNLQTGELELVSVADDGTPGNIDSSGGLAVNHDGRYVAFQSMAANLVPHDTNGETNQFDGQDIFVRDRVAAVTERVSVASSGADLPDKSVSVSISGDGRYVAYQSLKEGEDSSSFIAWSDALVHDRLTRTTELVTVAPDGESGEGDTKNPRLNPDGSLVAFQTGAANLTGIDSEREQIVLRERGPATGPYALRASGSGSERTVEGFVGFSGAVLASATAAGLPSPGGLSAASVVYRHEDAGLLVRLRVRDLPRIETTTSSRPLGGTYGLRFTVDGEPYEIRAVGPAALVDQPLLPAFGLYHCPAVCELVEPLDGGYGNTGEEVRVSLPLAALDLRPGDVLRDLRAFRDTELALADATIPEARLQLGVAHAQAPPAEVAFEVTAPTGQGAFSAIVPWPEDPAGKVLWARTCVGASCQISTTELP